MGEVKSIEWAYGRVRVLDQTRLPRERVVLELRRWQEVVQAIQEMRVRGAPALGIAAAYAVALAAREIEAPSREEFLGRLKEAARSIVFARPTAVNISWAVGRMLGVAEGEADMSQLRPRLLAEARRLQEEEEEANRRIGALGAELIPEGGGVLTHCNAGALATGGYGTALGVIRTAWEMGKRFRVFATETRPLLQGARLTTWELAQLGIPVTLIVDSAAGSLMRLGDVHCVIVGADRIAANGDVANKVGTYTLAVLARENGIPFYVAAPASTIDLETPSGDKIPIEERKPEEVTRFGDVQVAPEGVPVRNPAFDVTPHRYITAIITQWDILRPPYSVSLKRGKGSG